MKHDPKATANALALVGAALYIVCAAWVLVSKDSFMGVMNTWAHSIDLGAVPSKMPTFGEIVVGLITFTAAAWVSGYAFAKAYNYFLSKK